MNHWPSDFPGNCKLFLWKTSRKRRALSGREFLTATLMPYLSQNTHSLRVFQDEHQTRQSAHRVDDGRDDDTVDSSREFSIVLTLLLKRQWQERQGPWRQVKRSWFISMVIQSRWRIPPVWLRANSISLTRSRHRQRLTITGCVWNHNDLLEF